MTEPNPREAGTSRSRAAAWMGRGRTRTLDGRTTSEARRLLEWLQATPLGARLILVALVGAAAAAVVGYEAASNPMATPPHVAAIVRVLIVVMLVGGGIYAHTSHIQARIGTLLVAAGLYSAVWLLNGSESRAAFSIGALTAALAPTIFSYLMLVEPTGRLSDVRERWLLLVSGGVLLLAWLLLVLTGPQPPLRTGLMQCVPHCPRSVFTVASIGTGARTVLKVLVWVGWSVLTVGTAGFVWRHTRSGPEPVRRSITPVALAAAAAAVLWVAYALATAFGSHVSSNFGATYSEITLVIPVAILAGLGTERLFMGRALADFVTSLATSPGGDPQPMMALALRDPGLRICYVARTVQEYVDFSGQPVSTDNLGPARAISWVRKGPNRVAAVIYDASISGQDRFVEAAAAAALLLLDRVRLQLELNASVADLAASRGRLVETADAERQRIERDLHDSIQQDLVGLRIKLDLVAEAFEDDPRYGELMMTALGRQMDDLLEALRAVARGIYPSLLHERGLTEALRSAARRAPLAVAVRSSATGRYPRDVEVAVYFCCLEALQNASKHANDGGVIDIRLREEAGFLEFQVRDNGPGFDPAEVGEGHGLLNMRDRAEAIGGSLTISSEPGRGTVVEGRVPLS